MNERLIENLYFVAQFIESNQNNTTPEIKSMVDDDIKLFAAYEMALKKLDPKLTHKDLEDMVSQVASEYANESGEPSEIETKLIELYKEKKLDSFSFEDCTSDDMIELSRIFKENDDVEEEDDDDDHWFEEVYLYHDRLNLVFDGWDRDFGFLSEATQNKIYELISKAL